MAEIVDQKSEEQIPIVLKRKSSYYEIVFADVDGYPVCSTTNSPFQVLELRNKSNSVTNDTISISSCLYKTLLRYLLWLYI